jgi:hypothetical protein
VSEIFKICIASDQEHEKVVAEIYQGDRFVALVSQDNDQPMVEFPGLGLDESCLSRVVPLKGFQEAMSVAVRRLILQQPLEGGTDHQLADE